METSFYRYILKHSARDQIFLILLTAASMPIVYVSLDIPKRIVNQAIGGENIPQTFLGFELTQVTFLFLLCALYLVLVIANGGFKYVINVYSGTVGERMLRRFRYELYSRVLRFPLPHFKRTAQGEIIPMITAETQPLGEFIGESFSLPALMGGILLTYLSFIFVQDPLLGAAAIALYPLQMYIIPKLQRKVNALNAERVRTIRKVANRIGESVSGIGEIHAHDTSHFERADFSSRVGRIYRIRYELFRRKYFIKFLNNFLASITPFFFFSVGGYLVIKQQLSLGALVAVLAAYKDLSPPWKELLRYYQVKEDVRVKYAQIIEQFQPPDMLDPKLQDAEPETVEPIAGEVVAANVSYSEDGVVKSVDGINFRLNLKDHVAFVGPGGSGKDEVGRLIARLTQPTTGQIMLGGAELEDVPETVLGRRMGYVAQNAFVFAGTVRDNLFYGLKHRPTEAAAYDEAGKLERARREADAIRSGNSPYDVFADWIDYQAAGVDDPAEIDWKGVDVLGLVDMQDDIYSLGLASRIDPAIHEDLAGRILGARVALRERLEATGVAGLIEPFDETKYNENSSIAENLLFGTPTADGFDVDNLAENPYVRRILDQSGLYQDILSIGQQMAQTMVELFADLPPGHEFFEQYAIISSDDLPDYQALLGRVASLGLDEAPEEDRARLVSLAFGLIPARHRLGLLDDAMQARILKARRLFAEQLPPELADAVEFFNADRYNAASSLQDNILFGKLAYGHAQAQARVGEVIGEVIDSLDLRREVMRVGLDYEVGIAGGRLSFAQRQKLAIARALIKNPDVIIVNEATASLDTTAEARVMDNLLKHMKGRGVIWVVNRARLARDFDNIFVMDGGKVVETGTFAELEKSGSVFGELLQTQ